MVQRYSDSGISPRTNVYAERKMLRHAAPTMVLEKCGGLMKQLPKNKTNTIKFRRPNTFTAADVPLQEGVTPSATVFTYTDVEATLAQYGQIVEVTDVIADTHEDPVLNDASQQCGENIGRTMEALRYGVLRAGTNVFYSNGSSRAAVNTALTLAKQRAVVRGLYAQKAMKITNVLSGSEDYETRPIEAAYIGVCHTDLAADIRSMTGFVPVAEYGQRQPICAEELGSVEDVRYLLSPDLTPFVDAGGTPGSAVVSTSGSAADVYPVLYFGKEAFGDIALRGQGAVSPTIIPPGMKTKDDPLGQRGIVGWKSYFVCKRLNENWMARLETGASAL